MNYTSNIQSPNKSSTLTQIRRLWKHLSGRRRKQLALLAILTAASSLAEFATVGAVLPFLGVLTAPEVVYTLELVQPFIMLVKVQQPQDLLFPITILFMSVSAFAGLARVTLLWFQTRLSMAIGADFSVLVYKRTLYQPYILHVSRNSSEILVGAEKAKDLVFSMIQPVLSILSSIAILLSVISALLTIQFTITLFAFIGFALIYLLVVTITKNLTVKNSLTIADQRVKVTKVLQEGLGGIRDVLIDGSQPFYTKLYREAFVPMQMAIASNQVISIIPRFSIESLGMVLIAGLAYAFTAGLGQYTSVSANGSGALSTIPILGALTVGAQRLLPVLQQIYSSYIMLKGTRNSIQDALDLLDQPVPPYARMAASEPIPFHKLIRVENLSFRYTPRGPWVLKNLNLEIPKGSRVGFVGVTGSGKSTLLDIVMGLLEPSHGQILIDNTSLTQQNTRNWQVHIAHVPQAIYLADTSIAENIAFGVPPEKIDMQRVRFAAEQAQIAKTIQSWPNGFNTSVGERGVRLSGGQRQRIGIARTLYKRADVIIFDEATSALDNDTEAAVIQAIETLGRDITILIIAHRLTTLKNCDLIIELADGGIKVVSSPKALGV